MTPEDMRKEIKKDGWYFARQEGSHRQYKHPTKKGRVTIAFTKGQLSNKTVESIRKQAGLL